MKGKSCKDSNKNGELIITRIELGINLSILKCFDFDKVTYWFIKVIYHLKTPNYPLIGYQIYVVISNRLMTLSSYQWANGDMGQPRNRLNNEWQQLNFIKTGGDRGIHGVVRPIMNGWVDTSAHYDDFS